MDDVNKTKLQLRSGLPTNVDKTPSPVTRLLINHGKPNFTIQRSAKTQNGNMKPTSPTPAALHNDQRKNNDFVIKSTTFNGVFKPSNISVATKQTLPQNGSIKNIDIDNEAAKVVLRRAKIAQTEIREDKDEENVPEFIRRQRRIQERLANQNISDFEKRRSGYFTQVLISPSSPNRQSFAETMASPAVKPGLEMPSPTIQHEDIKEEAILKEQEHEEQPCEFEEKSRENLPPDSVTFNGHVEEEEVAKAIEEVNKAVEGEDDDKTELEEHANSFEQETEQHVEVEQEEYEKQQHMSATAEETLADAALVSYAAESTVEQVPKENFPIDSTPINNEDKIEHAESNGEHLENGHLNAEKLENNITISHTNGLSGPSIPTPDPKGEKGVNFEPKTVVSFSQELGNGDNKYPDTVKVLKDAETSQSENDLKELTKLKFEITADNQDIEVKPILITENV